MASLLSSDKLELINAPELQDIKTTIKLLKVLGFVVSKKETSILFNASKVNNFDAPYELVKTMRASILVLGPLLARFGKARVSMPGGCAIGSRPVDIHIKGLEAMGAKIAINHGYIEASSSHLPNGRLQGAKIFMDQVTVTGTENLLMAAVLADGFTILDNAAREPEVVDLGECLQKMGANIQGLGSDKITIKGVPNLKGASHKIMFDRIEAGTYLIAAAVIEGNLRIRNVIPKIIQTEINTLKNMGAKIKTKKDEIHIIGNKKIKSLNIKTAPYPGFPTDLQAQIMVLLCKANRKSLIKEDIFENRFMHVAELNRMGAQISINGNKALIKGNVNFTAAELMATDLRASVSLILAALTTNGKSVINRIYHLDRGYENIDKKLKNVGAKIRRINQ